MLGYPTQIPDAKQGSDGFNTDPGHTSKSGPEWTKDGSYLVFRRLAQDVQGFRRHVKELAAANGLSEDLMGAKLVGRFKSGCPIETPEFQEAPRDDPRWLVDPGRIRPVLHASNVLNNNFEFGDDKEGAVCQVAAHIRKAYPRDAAITPDGKPDKSAVQTHRLLRRGIPFGESFNEDEKGSSTVSRGLLFLAYQRDIENQFEFVQLVWINEPKFPPYPANITPGKDPIIAQTQSGTFRFDPSKANITVNHFVATTGGEYFFAPSMEALRKIGSNAI